MTFDELARACRTRTAWCCRPGRSWRDAARRVVGGRLRRAVRVDDLRAAAVRRRTRSAWCGRAASVIEVAVAVGVVGEGRHVAERVGDLRPPPGARRTRSASTLPRASVTAEDAARAVVGRGRGSCRPGRSSSSAGRARRRRKVVARPARSMSLSAPPLGVVGRLLRRAVGVGGADEPAHLVVLVGRCGGRAGRWSRSLADAVVDGLGRRAVRVGDLGQPVPSRSYW